MDLEKIFNLLYKKEIFQDTSKNKYFNILLLKFIVTS